MNDNVTAGKSYTFYGTFGSGQPNFPGYFEVTVKAGSYQAAYEAAYARMGQATGNRWCSLYDSLDEVHHLDLVFRGKA